MEWAIKEYIDTLIIEFWKREINDERKKNDWFKKQKGINDYEGRNEELIYHGFIKAA